MDCSQQGSATDLHSKAVCRHVVPLYCPPRNFMFNVTYMPRQPGLKSTHMAGLRNN